MADHVEIGKRGEKIAIDFLREKGYQILHRNWRKQRGEIDIIAQDGQVLVFVEVKTRAGTRLAIPEANINDKKKRMLGDTAFAFMEEHHHQWTYRIDIISILMPNNTKPLISHYKDAIEPWEDDITSI